MKKIFLLFGANGNLGKAAVDYFLTQNYDEYFIFSRKPIDIYPAKNVNQIIVEDLTKEINVRKAFQNVNSGKGNIYFLFSTIGGYSGGQTIAETSIEEWNRLVSINLTSALLISKHFMKLVQDSSGGTICFTSASSGLEPKKNNAIYGLTKNGLNFLVKSLSLEGAEINLTANAVAPYIIDTEENRQWAKDISMMVSPKTICETVQKIFLNWQNVSGEIVQEFD
ncbi:MAG: SDR family NAD(P)-dependent oxidoreductase [Bacteroidota bacterium]